jgi:hypothetical protein
MASQPIEYAQMIQSQYAGEQSELLMQSAVSTGAANTLNVTFTPAAGRRWQTRVWGILCELIASDTQNLPAFEMTVTGTTPWGTANANTIQVNPAAATPLGGQKRVRLFVFPTQNFQGNQIVGEWGFQPQFVATVLPEMTITVAVPTALPSGVAASYQLLTKGQPDIDGLRGELLRSRMKQSAEIDLLKMRSASARG